jgi:acyl-CoA synthetase (AMP-forming)/AMP-acid ligase II/pyrroloquinoline quinone (PQQ) biosynthesis protein C
MTMMIETLRRHAAENPERIALDPVTAAPLSYAGLLAQVEAEAARLRLHFPQPQTVALQLDHGAAATVLELALLDSGLPVLSLPRFFTADQTRKAMTASGVTACFAEPEGTGFRRRTAPAVTLPDGTARITFTSGSTGDPKGVCLSGAHMLTVAGAIVESVGSHHAGRHLALLPPGILLETVGGLFATVLAGGTYVCPPQAAVGLADPFRPDFAAMLDMIERQRITSLILVPEYLGGLVREMIASGRRLPLLTLVAVGGARVPPELVEHARSLGLPVRQGYGLTEFASVVSLEDEEATGAGSAGRPLPHVTIRIAGDGEIMLGGPQCLGMIGGPSAVGAASPAEGEYATGDIGRIDAEGNLWIEGRKSNLIVTSFGRNVSPEWVESALLLQPEIMQAMVHGDGLPQPLALLVPAGPDADIAAAVARANRLLPGYAHVAAWQEVPHFTPMNGQLTGNGRLRRKAIADYWLAGEPGFYKQLEAATIRDRLRFLSIPQVQAGLSGTISLPVYRNYLAQAWHHVRHTVPLMEEARAGLADRPELVAALDEYIAEETGHDEWILSDIAVAGGNAEAVRRSDPAPATAAMVQHAYDTIRGGNPVAFFGMVYVLESVSVALATRGAGAVAERLGLPPQAFTYLTSHGALDQDHLVFFADLVDALEREEDRAAILAMARDMFTLFGGMFAGLDLEAQDNVAA